MAERGWPGHGLGIGAVELRRSIRALREAKARLVLFAVFGLFAVLSMGLGAFLIVRVLPGVLPVALPPAARGSFVLPWAFAAFIFAQRAVSQHDRIDAEDLMLTTVSPRTVALGLVVAEFLRAVLYVAVPTVVLGGAFVYATQSPVSVVAIPLSVGLFVATSLVVGYVLGIAGALLAARSRFVARHKTALGIVLVVGFFGVYALVQVTDWVDPAVLAAVPVGWYADLMVVGSPVRPSLARAGVALGGSLALIAAGAPILERLTTAYWYTDPVELDTREARTAPAADPLAAALPFGLPAGLSAPTRRIAQVTLIRTRRRPARLSVLLAPLVVVGSAVGNTIGTGRVVALVPVVAALVVPWLAGAAFGLNPLGDQGAVLPATLAAGVSGRQFVRGLAVPGLLFGLPAALLGTLLAGLASPYAPGEIAGLVALGVALTPAAVGVAPAVGVGFPRLSAVSVSRSREVVPPSLSAVAVYSFAVGLPGGLAVLALLFPRGARALLATVVAYLPGIVLAWLAGGNGGPLAGAATWFRGAATAIVATPLAWVRVGGYALPVLAALALGAWGARRAARRLDRYTIE